MASAKLLRTFGPYTAPGKLKISELFFSVPKDYARPKDGTLQLFARSVRLAEVNADLKDEKEKQLPWMVYLQGGPGFECSSPQNYYSFVKPILDKGYQILFLDQRGTGLSSPISAATLAQKGNAQEQANYLKFFRADNIVADCEAIREVLTAYYPKGKKQWSLMSQSFGGFCAICYLSKYPASLREVFTCGGLPPLVRQPDDVYRHTYKKVIQRNQAYYKKYPEDIERVKRLVQYFADHSPKLPSGGHLSVLRFRQFGLAFGTHGGIDVVHEIVLRAYYELENLGFLTVSTLTTIDGYFHFDQNVLYSILHESIYCQGMASEWSASRIATEFPQFRSEELKEEPFFFTGEMIFPGMFDDYAQLVPLKEAANLIAEKMDWPFLYDENQLRKNTVPVYAVVFVDDMYVDFDLSRETASKIGNCKQYITNAIYHDGIRSKSEDVIKQLFALRDDVLD
ncbi:alpha/beta-hydrolase [Xylona heveae TC161]|uniref:Alpha/beta-hydrolase n=1 Tax=Xylona heveae (strain CBS 132557 / TC161) TaxID=1328760 RepID=A0A165I447_XYLHT|nr:alpha/beta-hydrolase [Xylona heveae TC161]KZF24358.1 alpha/beta-hydrolase [Xylona heveae TC161]